MRMTLMIEPYATMGPKIWGGITVTGQESVDGKPHEIIFWGNKAIQHRTKSVGYITETMNVKAGKGYFFALRDEPIGKVDTAKALDSLKMFSEFLASVSSFTPSGSPLPNLNAICDGFLSEHETRPQVLLRMTRAIGREMNAEQKMQRIFENSSSLASSTVSNTKQQASTLSLSIKSATKAAKQAGNRNSSPVIALDW